MGSCGGVDARPADKWRSYGPIDVKTSWMLDGHDGSMHVCGAAFG